MGTPSYAMAAARARGFSLIELMTAVGVLAILVVIAVPSFIATINSNRLATASNELVSTLQQARLEAVRRAASVVVCASDDSSVAAPDCSPGPWNDWFSFVDLDNDGIRDAGEPVLRASRVRGNVVMAAGPPMSTEPGNWNQRIRFRPDGLAYAADGALVAGTINACIETSQPTNNGRDVNIIAGGSVVVENAAPDPTCPEP